MVGKQPTCDSCGTSCDVNAPGSTKKTFFWMKRPYDGGDYISGANWASMRKNYSLIPIYGFCGLAVGFSFLYLLRLAFKSPEVAWVKNPEGSYPEPWEAYRQKQYKFLSSGRDYSLPSEAPLYKEFKKEGKESKESEESEESKE